MNSLVEGDVRATKCLHAECARNVEYLRHLRSLISAVHRKCSHHLRTVDERQSLLCSQANGREPVSLQHAGSRNEPPINYEAPLAHQRQYKMRQLNQIAAASDRAFCRYEGNEIEIEDFEQLTHDQRPDPAESFCESIRAKENDKSNDIRRERIACSR